MLVVSSWERKLIFEIHTKNERSKAFDLASEVAGMRIELMTSGL